MITLIIILAIAVIPPFILICSPTLYVTFCRKHPRRSLAWLRTRRNVLRALAAGVMLR